MNKATLYVPVGSSEKYRQDTDWKHFLDIQVFDPQEMITSKFDLNGDGAVDVSDISLLIDVVLGK